MESPQMPSGAPSDAPSGLTGIPSTINPNEKLPKQPKSPTPGKTPKQNQSPTPDMAPGKTPRETPGLKPDVYPGKNPPEER